MKKKHELLASSWATQQGTASCSQGLASIQSGQVSMASVRPLLCTRSKERSLMHQEQG